MEKDEGRSPVLSSTVPGSLSTTLTQGSGAQQLLLGRGGRRGDPQGTAKVLTAAPGCCSAPCPPPFVAQLLSL